MTAVFFDYEYVKFVPPYLIFTVNAPFEQAGSEIVAVVHKDHKVTETPYLTIRNAGQPGELLLKTPIAGDLNLRELNVGELTTPVEIGVFGPDKAPLIPKLSFTHNFDFRLREAKPVELPAEVPAPTPEPTPDPYDIVEYRVIWDKGDPPGMYVRADHDTSSTKIGELPTGAIVECDESRFWLGDSLGWLPIVSGQFAGNWVAFYSFVPGDRFNIVDEFLIPAEDYVEPEPTDTVQLTGKIKLIDGADGFKKLSNLNRHGLNQRSMVHWSGAAQDQHLDWMVANGLTILRVYVAHHVLSMDECMDRLEILLAKCKARGIQVIVVITDSIGLSGYFIAEYDDWHTVGSLGHLPIDWYTGRHYDIYLEWVHECASRFGQHEALVGIDLMNEPGVYGVHPVEQKHTDAVVDCFAEASMIVYTSSGGRLFSTVGLINARHICPTNKDPVQHAIDVYRSWPHVQVVSCHAYSNDGYHHDAIFEFEKEHHTQDYIAAQQTGTAIITLEVGVWFSNNDRPAAMALFDDRNPQRSALCYWSACPYDSPEVKGAGDCDGFAADSKRDGDFVALIDVVNGSEVVTV